MNADISMKTSCGRQSVTSSALRYVLLILLVASAIIALSYCLADSSDGAVGDQFERDYIQYEVVSESDKTVKIYGCVTLNITGDITIPDTVDYISEDYKVESIDANVFKKCSQMTSLTVGANVKYIGDSAFCECTSLRTVSLGAATITIGTQSFNGCTSMVSLTMGNNLTTINSEAFSGCSSLRTVRLGNSVDLIGSFAFNNCFHLVEICNDSPLKLVKGDESHGRIAKYAVNIYQTGSGNSIMKSQDLGESGIAVFYSDVMTGTSLVAVDNPGTSITLPDSLSGKSYSIGKYAFSCILGINSVVLGAGTTEICDSAFSSCSNLTTITLNSGLTYIGQNAFSSCPLLTSMIIPNSVTDLGSDVFRNCISLTEVSLGTGVTGIPNFAFCGCSSITGLYYGDQIIAFGNGAFQDCTSLSTITIKKNIIAVMNGTFSGCTKLKGSSSDIRVSVLATSVPDLGSDAFPSGTYITVPAEKLSDYKTGWAQYADTIVADSFDVVFMNGSQVFHSYRAQYGDTVVLPNSNPTKESTDKYDYKFKSWSGYTEGMKVTGNLTFDAVYEEIPKDTPGSGGNNTVVIIVVAVVIVLAAIGAAIFLLKRKGQS